MFVQSNTRPGRQALVRAWVLSAVVLVCSIAPAHPGEEPARVSVKPRLVTKQGSRSPGAIRMDIKLVLVPVTVTDPFGAPVNGLPRSAFRVFEDGVEQDLTYFAADDAPMSLGVVFDASKSMQGKLDKSRAAMSQVFRSSMTGDEFFLVEFNSTPRLLSAFTTDTSQIERSLSGIIPRNWTALLDAVYLGIHQMRYARHQRKALLILSDGADNSSRYTEAEMKRLVREADVCIYSIALTGGSFLKRHLRSLQRLSEETGGVVWEVEKLDQLPEVVEKMNRTIRNQYLLGFSSKDGRNNGMYRKIEVRLNPLPDFPPLRAFWRGGYYAPGEY